MKMVKSLLLGTAAGLVAVAGAQAADMPVKAAPVQYVKICSLYGDGFYYIPGTDTCLKMGGYLRVQAEYNAGAGGILTGDGTQMAPQGRFTRDLTNDINYRVRGAISWDVRQQTEYGTLRTYIRFGAENTTPAATGGGTTFNPFWDRAFIQFAGFTVGRSQSFFDLFTYGGAYSYHNVRVSGDTGASGQNLWAYTAQFGNGFSGTLSLEDPATRKGGGTVDVTNAAFFGSNGSIVNDNGLTINNANFGFRVPDIIANLRLDQAWGFVGISAALHDASAAYYATPNVVNNGHPEDRYGWAMAGGAKFNLPGGDMVGFNVCYSEGAAGMCTNQQTFQVYNNSNSVALGLDCRRCLQHRHPDRADQGVECSCRVRAHLEPEMADRGRSAATSTSTTTGPRPTSSTRGSPVQARRTAVWWQPVLRSPPSLRRSATAAAPTTASGKPIPAPSGTRCRSSISVCEVLYHPSQHRLQRRGGVGGERLASRRRQRGHRRPERLVRDVPLAAQLLSMIA